MKNFITKKRILIVFLVMISATSLFYAYKKLKINRPISAKLVFSDQI